MAIPVYMSSNCIFQTVSLICKAYKENGKDCSFGNSGTIAGQGADANDGVAYQAAQIDAEGLLGYLRPAGFVGR